MISEPNSTMDDRELADLSELIEDFDEETARELALAFLEDTANALEKLDVALWPRTPKQFGPVPIW